jgi:hypothetical protein
MARWACEEEEEGVVGRSGGTDLEYQARKLEPGEQDRTARQYEVRGKIEGERHHSAAVPGTQGRTAEAWCCCRCCCWSCGDEHDR